MAQEVWDVGIVVEGFQAPGNGSAKGGGVVGVEFNRLDKWKASISRNLFNSYGMFWLSAFL